MWYFESLLLLLLLFLKMFSFKKKKRETAFESCFSSVLTAWNIYCCSTKYIPLASPLSFLIYPPLFSLGLTPDWASSPKGHFLPFIRCSYSLILCSFWSLRTRPLDYSQAPEFFPTKEKLCGRSGRHTLFKSKGCIHDASSEGCFCMYKLPIPSTLNKEKLHVAQGK